MSVMITDPFNHDFHICFAAFADICNIIWWRLHVLLLHVVTPITVYLDIYFHLDISCFAIVQLNIEQCYTDVYMCNLFVLNL